MLHIDDQVVAQLVQLIGGNTGFDERADVIEYFTGQTTGDAHFLDFLRGFDETDMVFRLF